VPRKHERKTIFTEVDLESASGTRVARISDLSLGGCFVDTIVIARPGEMVSLKIKPENSEPIEIKGNVAYIFDGTGFGVSFIDVSDEAQAALEKLTAEL
jgi:PilZ domain